MKLSIIIPAYNEELRIRSTLQEYYSTFMKVYGNDFEIIVEMDGCTDNTPRVVQEFARDKSNIKVIQVPQRLGKGGGIQRALPLAEGVIIGFTDADNSTPPNEFLKLVNAVEGGADVAICSRWLEESVVINPQPLFRRVLSRGFNILVRILLGLNFKDTQCGAKVFTREFAELMMSEMNTIGFAFDVEMLYLAENYGFKVVEIPICWYNHEDSKLKVKKAVPEMFISLFKIRFRRYDPHPRTSSELRVAEVDPAGRD